MDSITECVMIERLLKLPLHHSLLLLGARNTGKSTLIKQTYPTSHLIDLLQPDEEEKFARNPKELQHLVLAMPDHQTHVLIDEIQKVPVLLNVVHSLIESTNKIFVLTGSSARKIKKGAANLLAGRAFVYHLHPFSFLELGDAFSLHKALSYGLLPKIYHYTEEQDCMSFLGSYAHTYLKEEVWAEHWIKKLEPFRKFLEVAAQMNGKIINFHRIALDVGVDDKTVKEYFSILEDTLIGFCLDGFHSSVRKRLLSKPKFYFFDVGVKRSLARELSIPVQSGTFAYGELFEQFVVTECKKLASYYQPDFQFSYFMTKDGLEIDLVVERPAKPNLFIEIKSKNCVGEYDLKSLRIIKNDLPTGEFVCFSDDPYPKEIEGIRVWPWRQGIQTYFC